MDDLGVLPWLWKPPYMQLHRYDRRKFRSQTSDNMERWKSRGGKSQGGEDFTLHYTRLHYIHYPSVHYTRPITPLQYDCNYTTLITLHNYTTTQLHYATTSTTAAVHKTTSSRYGRGDHCNHCNHSNKHNSNHLSVNQRVRSAIRDSQQPTSPIGFLFWNFRHRLARHYW